MDLYDETKNESLMYKNSNVWPDAFTRMGARAKTFLPRLCRQPHTRRRRPPNGRAGGLIPFIEIDLERLET